MGAELLPCPMCGCAATFVKHSAGFQGTQGFDKWDAVACKHCRTTVGACDRRFRCREDAAEAWNRRVPQSALESERQAHAAEVAALKLRLEVGPLYSTRLKARRYDWLRNEAHPDRDDTGLSVSEQDFNDWGKPFTRYLSGDALDAAIDQAIARGTK